MGAMDPRVWIVEDDPAMRDSFVWLLESTGHRVVACAKPSDLLEQYDSSCPGCLLLDQRLPEMSGLVLWRELRQLGCRDPAIFVSAYGDVSTVLECWHDGAVDFLQKPFVYELLLARIDLALRRSVDDRRRRAEHSEFQRLVDSLTPREQEVLDLVAEGMLTKEISKQLEISAKTVEVHRSRIMRKLGIHSLAELVRRLTRHQMQTSNGGSTSVGNVPR